MNEIKNITDFIKKTPKTELHLHIEGSLEPELMFKLSKRNKIEIPFKNVEEIKSAYNFSNLDSFLKIYYEGSKVLINEKDFFDLTWEYLLRCKEDNIVHTEIFFDPQSHLSRGVSFETVLNGIDKALKKAEKDLGISSKIIMCFLRHLEEDACFDVLKLACNHKDKIIGVGLDSSEKGNPPSKFKKLFEQAIKEGFLTVAHAGEEGDSKYIWEAIKCLKVRRIDHGVRCFEDEGLVQYLVDTQMPLTVCPLSNVDLCVFKDLKEHTLAKMLECGIMATINSDDPAYFGGYLLQNYVATQEALCLSAKQMAQLAENSFRASLLPPSKINEYSQEIQACVQRYQNA